MPPSDDLCGNGLDDDRDGAVDEECTCDAGASQTCYRGDPALAGIGACVLGMQQCTSDFEFSSWDACVGDGSPATEICDRVDNDCDGTVDEGCACTGTESRPCGLSVGACMEGRQECSGGVWSECTGGINPIDELCNGLDDNCNGRADFMIRPGDFEDDDGDGFADMACGGNDCDDANPAIYPGAPEICDGLDNNCDGIADGDDAMALWVWARAGEGFGGGALPLEGGGRLARRAGWGA